MLRYYIFFMKHFSLIWTTVFFLLTNTTLAQVKQDKWTGSYQNKETGLELKINGKTDGFYSGEFILGSQRFPAQGITLLGVFSGEYLYEGKTFNFSLTASANQWILTVDGTSVVVEKSKLAEVNTNAEEEKTVKTQSTGPEKTVPTQSAPKPSTGKRMADSYAGYSFAIPVGWQCTEVQGSFKLTKTGENADLSVSPHYTASVQQALAESGKPITDEASQTHLVPITKPYGDNGIQISLSGQAQGKPLAVETISLMSPHGGGGVSIAAVSLSASASTYIPLLASIAASVTFSAPKQHPQAAAWQQKLVGKKLLYLKTEGGGTTKIVITLNHDGSYYYSYQSSYMSGGFSDFSYADANKDNGHWRIISRGNDILLIGVSSQKDETTEYLLQRGQNDKEVILGNLRYFITAIE